MSIEAVIKLFNLFAEYEFDEKTGNNAAGLRNFAYPFVVDDINANYKIHNEYLQFLETGKTPETVTAGYDSTVEACEKYNKDGNMEGWSMYAIFGPDSTESARQCGCGSERLSRQRLYRQFDREHAEL